jgi:hypothetical protein
VSEVEKINIRPTQDRRVIDPNSMQLMPAKGIEVLASDTGWYRRWLDSDVEVFDPATGAVIPHPHAPVDPAPAPDAAEGAATGRRTRSNPASE